MQRSQYNITAVNHRRVVQEPLASGIIFQMDQATPAHQTISGNERERRENANLVRRIHIRVKETLINSPHTKG